MVRIINYKESKKDDGTSFYLLELQGGIEMAKSQTSGQYYATAKKAWISSTFEEMTCQSLLGAEIPGDIEKQEVEPYTYLIKETGEEIILHHRWIFIPVENNVKPKEELSKDHNLEIGINAFSSNGKYAEI